MDQLFKWNFDGFVAATIMTLRRKAGLDNAGSVLQRQG
jgi:hypothetical protein